MLYQRATSDESSQRRYVRASDRRLAEVVAQASGSIDWNDVRRRHAKVSEVTTEQVRDGTIVSATCILECSMAEIGALINPPTSQHYVAAMRDLIGQDFIYGAIVHHAKEITTQDVTVKTVTLMKRHLLTRSEQWCYVSSTKALEPTGDLNQGYTITVASLHPDDVFIGKAQASSVIHLQGLSSAYIVTPEERTVEDMKKNKKAKRAIRLTCYSHVAKSFWTNRPSRLRWLLSSVRSRDEVDVASYGVVVTRATQMSQMLQHYGVVVRRRRIDAQVLANLREVQPANSRCVSCTRRVDSKFSGPKRGDARAEDEKSSRSKRCEICGFLVCDRCVCTMDRNLMSKHLSEISSSSSSSPLTVYLCEHCMQRVDDADYDNLSAASCSMTPTSSLAASVQADPPDADASSVVIARVLSNVLGNATPEEKPVVIRVIQHLLSPRVRVESKFRADPDDLARGLECLVLEQKLSESLIYEETNQVDEVRPEDDENPSFASVEELMNSGRYRFADSDDDDVPAYPIPADENQRLGWIDSHPGILGHMTNLPELELLCEVARGELRCDAASVTIIGPDFAYVVASTDASWRGCSLPRTQSVCAHVIMNKSPMLVPHPEADVRFSAMKAVCCDEGARFYFGFPILMAHPQGDTIAVGSFCCAHAGQSRDVSESQYALMTTLAEGATRVMETHASLLQQRE